MSIWRRLKNLWILSTYTLPANTVEQKGWIYERLVKPRNQAKIINTDNPIDNVDLS